MKTYRPEGSPESRISKGEPYVAVAINIAYEELAGRAIREIAGVSSCVYWTDEFVIRLDERTQASAKKICEAVKETLPPLLPHFVEVEPEIRMGK